MIKNYLDFIKENKDESSPLSANDNLQKMRKKLDKEFLVTNEIPDPYAENMEEIDEEPFDDEIVSNDELQNLDAADIKGKTVSQYNLKNDSTNVL